MDEQNNYEDMMNQSVIQGQVGQSAATSAAHQYYLQEQEKGIIDVQLEVDSIKTDIFHLLKQDVLKTDDNGKTDWFKVDDIKQRTLSDWGVDRIMQVIHFYINKNNLLTNFSEEQINRLMLRFMTELNDLVLLKYQKLFRQLTFEECKEVILEKLEDKKKMRMFTLEVLGKEPDEKQIKKELLEEMEKTLESEMLKIREEQRKEKIRDYGLLIVQLEIIIYGALNRAWKGEERGSIRRHTTISELIGQRQNSPQKKGGIFSWGRS